MKIKTPQSETGEPRLVAPLIMACSVALMLVLSLAATGILMFYFSRQCPLNHMQALGLVIAPDQKPLTRFPKPNLQLDDGHSDSTALAAQQRARLNSYGWVDHSQGIVHIPVERAMALVLAQGLPAQSSATNVSPLKLEPVSP